ncbi:hypothetical protein KIL84_007250 [Mauremys mutica]|uniref:Uncharacterized protein n=1 Tax=Mauremys mutica TaxID=74926 RepID=A0A9D3X2P0_9SAUR|nr:hypothetical protein KIL84_007250 [Mauremys mutica]
MQLVRSRNIQVVVVDRDVEGSAPAGTSNVAAGPNVATDVKPLETANMADNAKPLDQSKAAASEPWRHLISNSTRQLGTRHSTVGAAGPEGAVILEYANCNPQVVL